MDIDRLTDSIVVSLVTFSDGLRGDVTHEDIEKSTSRLKAQLNELVEGHPGANDDEKLQELLEAVRGFSERLDMSVINVFTEEEKESSTTWKVFERIVQGAKDVWNAKGGEAKVKEVENTFDDILEITK